MYKDINKEKRSKGYLLDAIQAVKDKDKSRFFPKGLSLIGVYLDSDFLKASQVLAEPTIGVNLEDDVGITLDVTLRPESNEDPILKILELVLATTNTGMFMERRMISEEEDRNIQEARKLSKLMMPRGALENITDPKVALFFNEDSVRLQRFKMVGETYFAFSLTEESYLEDELYQHTLYVLFKERGSSMETFFSGLVGSKLDKRVTTRVLESVAQKNITGMFIGGVTINTEYTNTITYATTSTSLTLLEDEGDTHIHIRTSDTVIAIEMDDIEYSEVLVNTAGKYSIVLHLKGDTEVYIYVG